MLSQGQVLSHTRTGFLLFCRAMQVLRHALREPQLFQAAVGNIALDGTEMRRYGSLSTAAHSLSFGCTKARYNSIQ